MFRPSMDSISGTKTNIKKGFFTMIDNVLGGGQSSTSQIAHNMSMISNNLSNVSCLYPKDSKAELPQIQMSIEKQEDEEICVGDISPQFKKQQKLFDANTTM